MRLNQTDWLLVATALALAAAALDDFMVLVFTSSISSLIFIYLIYDLLVCKQAYRFFLISSLACGAWVSLGVVQSGIASAALEYVDFSVFFNQLTINISISDYAISMAYLYLFIMCCDRLSRLPCLLSVEKKIALNIVYRLRTTDPSAWTMCLASLSIFLFSLSYLNLFSIRGLSFESLSGQDLVPWWYPIVSFLISLLPLLVSGVLSGVRSFYSTRLVVGIIGLSIGFYYSALQGRSNILAYIFSLLFCWVLISDPILKLNRTSLSLLILLVIAGVIIIPLAQNFFTFINYIRTERGLYVNPSLFISSYLDYMKLPDQVQIAALKSTENLASRPLLLWPLAASIKMSWLGLNNGYLYFQDIVNSFLNSMPRFLFGTKKELLLQEDLLYKYFPFANVDTADSPYLYSFVSFWFFGILAYPVFIASIYFVFLRFVLLVSKSSSIFFPAIFAVSPLATFAIFSYGEISTTGLFRLFLVPALFVGGWKLASMQFTTKKASIPLLDRVL